MSQSRLRISVFDVRGSKRWSTGNPETMFVMKYVRLGNVNERGAVAKLGAIIMEEHHVPLSNIIFKFWCDGYTCNDGPPIVVEGAGRL